MLGRHSSFQAVDRVHWSHVAGHEVRDGTINEPLAVDRPLATEGFGRHDDREVAALTRNLDHRVRQFFLDGTGDRLGNRALEVRRMVTHLDFL